MNFRSLCCGRSAVTWRNGLVISILRCGDVGEPAGMGSPDCGRYDSEVGTSPGIYNIGPRHMRPGLLFESLEHHHVS